MADQTPKYDETCRLINEMHAAIDDIDQCDDIDLLTRIARNTEAECRACEIRLRAERKGWRLQRKLERDLAIRATPTRCD